MMSLMTSNYPHLILPSIQNHGESLAGFDVLDETRTPALLIRWGKKERPKISTSNRDEATTHGPDASTNVPCGNWFWLPVWGFTITLLSRVYFFFNFYHTVHVHSYFGTTGSLPHRRSPLGTGTKLQGLWREIWETFEMDLEKEKELMWVWNVRVKQY